MYTCSGEKVFVGNASAIAFLQFLRGSLSSTLGSNGFTISQGSHSMFEAQLSLQQPENFEDDVDDEERRNLSSGLLDLFEEYEIVSLLGKPHCPREQEAPAASTTTNDGEGSVCLYMMMAIGAQCRGQPGDLPRAYRYFSQARKLSFEGFLTEPTLNTARGFVLMAFYMFGACRRNAAFMYLGVATKAASVLGLHMSDHFQSLPEQELLLRSRIDRSIRLFDVVCSSILGRPVSSVPDRRRRRRSSSGGTDSGGTHRSQSVQAGCQFSQTLNGIVDKLTSDGRLGVATAESFLEEIRAWSGTLPAGLRSSLRHPSGGALDRQTAIGNIHVACAYYFGIIATTREFLIQRVMSQLHQDAAAAAAEQAADTAKAAELAGVCVDAAAYMADMCFEALDTGVIMGNMCILKAWLFAAGLILGFSLLDVAAPWSRNSNAAFRNTLRVLEFLGKLSPQAGQYHRVLTSFSQALETYRRRSAGARGWRGQPYVERLLSLGSGGRCGTATRRRRSFTGLAADTDDQPARERSADVLDGASSLEDNVGDCLGASSSLPHTFHLGGEDLILSLLWEKEDEMLAL
ncbi:putative transcriptional regulatory protein [Colletotrichum trifolii]|uniref:Putative transcriptional regulatory protein n=1 Tax=Colletotrichum trifolii TaxID=5466 RepID=A0A4R8RMJ0_COLTR|nr:putative transcriptional regulatory protein [Colletotrichum trifolii]